MMMRVRRGFQRSTAWSDDSGLMPFRTWKVAVVYLEHEGIQANTVDLVAGVVDPEPPPQPV